MRSEGGSMSVLREQLTCLHAIMVCACMWRERAHSEGDGTVVDFAENYVGVAEDRALRARAQRTHANKSVLNSRLSGTIIL